MQVLFKNIGGWSAISLTSKSFFIYAHSMSSLTEWKASFPWPCRKTVWYCWRIFQLMNPYFRPAKWWFPPFYSGRWLCFVLFPHLRTFFRYLGLWLSEAHKAEGLCIKQHFFFPLWFFRLPKPDNLPVVRRQVWVAEVENYLNLLRQKGFKR